MRTLFAGLVVAVACLTLSSGDVLADDHRQSLQTMALEELLADVGRKSGESFLLDARVPARVVVGPLGKRDVTYPLLLTVLRNNDLAAVRVSGVVSIIPVGEVRNYTLPQANDDGPEMHDDEWVLRLVSVENAPASRLVPFLRPLIAKPGHLVGDDGSGTVIIVATYSVSERIADIIEELDQSYTGQSG